MIREIAVQLKAALLELGCREFAVVTGPEPFKQAVTYTPERMVLEWDAAAGDAYGAVKSQHSQPKHAQSVVFSAKVTIYARSSRVGAETWEHQRRAHKVMRVVVPALTALLRTRKNPPTWSRGAFVPPKDLEGSDKPSGAAYELKFAFESGISDASWTNEVAPEATLGAGSVTSTTKVGLRGATGDDDDTADPPAGETACGA